MEETREKSSKKERRGINSFLVMLLVLLLGGVIGYLASMLNSQRYYLVAQNGQLTVEKGYFLPFGSGPFTEDQREYRELYTPIAIPQGEVLPAQQSFNNLGDLDRKLFSLLRPWAQKSMQGKEDGEFEKAVFYVERARKLSGLNEAQQKELSALRGDLAYREGRHLIDSAVENLQKALKAFRVAGDMGTTVADDVNLWINELERRLAEYKVAGHQGTPAELLLFKPVISQVPAKVPAAETVPEVRTEPAAAETAAVPGEKTPEIAPEVPNPANQDSPAEDLQAPVAQKAEVPFGTEADQNSNSPAAAGSTQEPENSQPALPRSPGSL